MFFSFWLFLGASLANTSVLGREERGCMLLVVLFFVECVFFFCFVVGCCGCVGNGKYLNLLKDLLVMTFFVFFSRKTPGKPLIYPKLPGK